MRVINSFCRVYRFNGTLQDHFVQYLRVPENSLIQASRPFLEFLGKRFPKAPPDVVLPSAAELRQKGVSNFFEFYYKGKNPFFRERKETFFVLLCLFEVGEISRFNSPLPVVQAGNYPLLPAPLHTQSDVKDLHEILPHCAVAFGFYNFAAVLSALSGVPTYVFVRERPFAFYEMPNLVVLNQRFCNDCTRDCSRCQDLSFKAEHAWREISANLFGARQL